MSNAPAPLPPIQQSRGYIFHQDPHGIHQEQRSSSVNKIEKDKNSPSSKMNISTPVCRNCKTQTTPLWRRDETGQVLCNACGLFLKLHGRPRPISLKTDVIKSRNRVKHSGKSHPNTPELKAKESVAPTKSQKFSPKQYKPAKPVKTSTSPRQEPSNSPALLPLLPRYQQQQQQQTQKFIHPSQHHLVQPLHYPSSTPAQFNTNLTAITSPLLLSSATPKFNPSQSSERGSLNGSAPTLLSLNSAASSSNNLALVNAAAGALENLANQESSKPFSPASALQTPSLTSLQDKESVGQSPSFGPQFCLSHPPKSSSIPSLNISQDHPSDHQLPSVRPLLQLGKRESSSPPMSRSVSSHSDDPNELKTRISELELVNDLYRTRIMELEAMEQAAKRREVDLQKKLREVTVEDPESAKRSSPTNEIGNDEKRIKQEQYRDVV